MFAMCSSSSVPQAWPKMWWAASDPVSKHCKRMFLTSLREDRESCVTCSEALCDGQRYESFDQQMSAGMRRNAPAEGTTRFRAFTFHAGFQFAVFQPKLCRACRWHYIAGWTYRADRKHITECKWIGPCPRTWFVIPKLRSWLAIDMALLSVLDSQLLHQKASFQSMFRVWADMIQIFDGTSVVQRHLT